MAKPGQATVPHGVDTGTLAAVVTRRDAAGNVIAVEDLGQVSATYRNPVKQLIWDLYRTVRDWHRVRTGKLLPPEQRK